MNAPSKQSRRAGWPVLLATAVAAALAACSGGGDAPAPAAATPAPASVSGSAAIGSADGRKGVLAGATACLDVDGNGACGSSEPRATTSADGGFAIASAAAAGLVVEVPASATADGVAVGRAFTLRAPAGSSAVTPLSTLVVAEMDQAGGTAAEAAERLRQRGALAASPLAALTDGDMARVAALVQRLGALQAGALAGSGLPEADIAREILRAQAAALADLAQAERDAASDDTLRAIAARIGPDAAQVAGAGRMFALAEPPAPATPEPGAQLTALRYTSSDNWFMRTLQSSADDLVADASGFTRYIDVYAQAAPSATAYPKGVIQRWNGATTLANAGNLHFNGSAWVTCGGLTARYRSTVRDAAGRNSYDFCDGWETGNSIRRVEDISNQEMSAVVRDKVRTFPGGSAGVSFASFGPSDLALLDGRVFPEGSYLFYQQQTITGTAPSYDPRDSNRVLLFSAGVAAGGDARSAPGIDCNNPALTATSAQVPATTLEEVVGRLGGRPCVYGVGGTSPDVSLDPNEWWGQSTLNLGDLNGFNTRPSGTGAYYNTTATLRVSFTAGGRARFHRCFRRASDSSPRNCTLMGLGTWRIDSAGDARVLSFSTLPAIAQRLGFARVLVERGGAVYFGSRSPVGVVQPAVRMNLTAANALIDALPGMPIVRPITRPGTATGARAAALVTLQGAWGGADLTEATIFRFGANGRFLMAEAKPYLAATQEQSGGELGWFDFDPAAGRISTLLEVDSNLTSGTSHPRDSDPPISITDTAIGSDGFTIPRLPDGLGATPTSLVGLWAVNSPTDLSVAHLAFFANGRAMFLTQQADADCLGGTAPGECPPGVEFASYTWNPATGTVVLTLIEGETILPGGQRLLHYDTNGCNGLFDTCPTAVAGGRETRTTTIVFTVAADGRTITFTGGDDLLYTLYRIPTRDL